MSRENIVQGLIVSATKIELCRSCTVRKLNRGNISENIFFGTQKVLEVVHSDIYGPLDVCSKGEAQYFVIFLIWFLNG